MIQYKKILMTLALLLTAVTGAWAAEPELLVTIESEDYDDFTSGSMTFDEKATVTFSAAVSNSVVDGWYSSNDISLTVAGANGYTITSCKFYTAGGDGIHGSTIQGESPVVYLYNINVYTGAKGSGTQIGEYGVTKIEVYGYLAEAPITVEPVDGQDNTWTFNQPGSDVVLTPIYAKTAAFATTGTEPEAKTLLPEAAEGVIAGTDAPLIAEGTGIVAFAGTSTEVTQGTVMYAVTAATATKAPELTAFSATVPTAKTIADDGATVKVWYYIQGADTPDGQEATADNTFNDSEVSSLTVSVRSNKFDIQFNAANANTIEAGKATVTVGGTAATVTEGKLEGVKMGSEVKVKANTGYKFRKVEVKKKAPTTTVTWSPVSCYGTYTQDGVTLTPSNGDAVNGNNFYQFGDNTFTTTLGKFIKIEIVFESTTYTFDGWTKGTAEQQYQPDPRTYPDRWENLLKLTWTGDAESVTIKGKDVFGIHSITFTIQ